MTGPRDGDGDGERRHRGCRLHRARGAATGAVGRDSGSRPASDRITGYANARSRRGRCPRRPQQPGKRRAIDADDDEDGLTNAAEDEAGTDPNLADTDEDGLTDGEEIAEIGTSPLSADTDSDGVLDGDEVAQGTDPLDGIAAAPTEETPATEEAPAADRRRPAPSLHLATATAMVWRTRSRSSWARTRSTSTPTMTD